MPLRRALTPVIARRAPLSHALRVTVNGEVRIDVRSIPRWLRHARVFSTFDALLADQHLLLVSDHEPRPLRAQFEERYGSRYSWSDRQLGDGRWEVRVRKVAAQGADDSVQSIIARAGTFSGITPDSLARLASRARRAAIKRHHTVVEQGVMWPYLGIVAHGIVQAVLIAASGREDVVYDALAGDAFGEAAILDRGNTALRHVALTADTQVVLIPTDALAGVIEREPAVLRALGELSAQRFRSALERFSLGRIASSTARVATALLPYAAPDAGMAPALAPLPHMTQVELALRAGTVKEVVNRALSELEEWGALRRDRGHIVELDRDHLTAFVASAQ